MLSTGEESFCGKRDIYCRLSCYFSVIHFRFACPRPLIRLGLLFGHPTGPGMSSRNEYTRSPFSPLILPEIGGLSLALLWVLFSFRRALQSTISHSRQEEFSQSAKRSSSFASCSRMKQWPSFSCCPGGTLTRSFGEVDELAWPSGASQVVP